MNALTKYISILLTIVFLSCASNPKPKVSAAEIEKLDSLIAGKSFEIEATWARPLVTHSINSVENAGLLPWGSTADLIDISGSNSYLRIKVDSLVANLPYFGERQLGGTYNNNNNGIQFEGVPKDLKIVKEKNNQVYRLDFIIRGDIETYDVSVRVYPNLNSSINITSSHRTAISYNGQIRTFSSN